MSTNICQYCGNEFEAKRIDKKFCSYSCENRGRQKDAVCLNCGNTFRKCGAKVQCCSVKCSKEYEWKQKVPTGVSIVGSSSESKCRFVETECKSCGKKIKIRHGDYNRSMRERGYITCSVACAVIQNGSSVKLTCSECGKEFYRARSGIDPNSKHFFCGKKCQKKNIDYILRGENHFRYVNGNTSLTRGKGWTQTRRIVRERDNFTCQRCGRTENDLGRALDVHHIKPYRMFDDYRDANKLENLIALCASCHHKTDAELASRLRNENA